MSNYNCSNCPPLNPCACVGITTNCVSPCLSPQEGCLKLCDIIILPEDGVGPCGASGSTNVADTALYGHDITACGSSPLYWSIEKIVGDAIVTASITPEGILTWVTGQPDTAGNMGTPLVEIVIRAQGIV